MKESDKESGNLANKLEMNRAGFAVLMLEVKSLQGASGVFHQFQNEYKTIKQNIKKMQESFEDEIDLALPKELDFIALAKGFLSIIKQSHLYPHHLEEITQELGSKNVYIKMVILERYLHSLDRVAPNFYQGKRHKAEIKQVIIQVLEDCYDEIEELEEEAEDEGNENPLLLKETPKAREE